MEENVMLVSLADRERLCEVIEKNLHLMSEEEKKIFQLILSLLYDLRDSARLARGRTRDSHENMEELLEDLELRLAGLSDRAFQAPRAEDIVHILILAQKVPELLQEIRRLRGVAHALILQAPESDARN